MEGLGVPWTLRGMGWPGGVAWAFSVSITPLCSHNSWLVASLPPAAVLSARPAGAGARNGRTPLAADGCCGRPPPKPIPQSPRVSHPPSSPRKGSTCLERSSVYYRMRIALVETAGGPRACPPPRGRAGGAALGGGPGARIPLRALPLTLGSLGQGPFPPWASVSLGWTRGPP